MTTATAQGGLARLAEVPHRACFAAGVAGIVSVSLWWVLMLAFPGTSAYPAVMAHGLMMPLSTFPLFMLGFLFTAGPRWLNLPPMTRQWPLAAAYLLGVLLALGGFTLGGAWPQPGLLLMLGAWSVGTLRWSGACARSQASDRRHARRMLAAMVMGVATYTAAFLWVWSGNGQLWLLARHLMFWAFLLPVFLVVSHRMVPFFTQAAMPFVKAWRPFWLLDCWLGAGLLLAVSGTMGWRWLEAGVALAMSASMAYTSWRWGLVASLQNRLLAMLHLSFAWLAPALLLQGLGALGLPVGTAPAHALGLGFCCTMLVGFVTRVTMGHSGRPLVADNGYWAIYLALHGVALLRVGAALFGLGGPWMHLLSAAWLALMLVWGARVLPIYWKARADGQPG